jgi:Serine dehydrogenase proteinase
MADPQEGASAHEPKKRFAASIFTPERNRVPAKFARLVKEIEGILEREVWCLVQNGNGPFRDIDHSTFCGFREQAQKIPVGRPVALIVESPGGSAHFAYRIARLFQRRASEFCVIVPSYAKSAATILALGASELILGRDAELGPVDVQIFDSEREEYGSALDAVQSLERLNAFSMTALDQTVLLLLRRTGKRLDSILPHALSYVTKFVHPLLEKIDTLDYTKKSRELKVAEEYALRLMRHTYDDDAARRIASKLAREYPTHGFVIDDEEARALDDHNDPESFGLGIKAVNPPTPLLDAIDKMLPYLDKLTVIGRIEEAADEK